MLISNLSSLLFALALTVLAYLVTAGATAAAGSGATTAGGALSLTDGPIAALRRLLEQLTVWASAFTDSLEVDLVKHLFRTGSMTKPTQWTVDLYTAMPGETGGGTIVTGGAYAGVRVDPLDANWAATSGTDGLTSNVSTVTFPAPTANWGVVVGFSLTDQTAMRVYGALTTSKTINNGDSAPSFGAGTLQITIA